MRPGVKAVRGGGKWPVGEQAIADAPRRIYVFLLYKSFDDVKTDPQVFVVPAKVVEKLKKPWLRGYAVFYSGKRHAKAVTKLMDYRDTWNYIA